MIFLLDEIQFVDQRSLEALISTLHRVGRLTVDGFSDYLGDHVTRRRDS